MTLLCLFPFINNSAFAELLGDKIKPFFSAREIYDSNVFRIKDENLLKSVVGDDQLSDFVTILTAGVDLNYEISRQKINILLRKDFLRFSHYTDQNSDQDKVTGNVTLRVFDRFSSKINGSYTKVLEPKEYYLTKEKNERTTRGGGIEIGYDMPLGFTIKTGFRHEEIDYSLLELDVRERMKRIYSGAISYSPSPDTMFDIVYVRDTIDYDILQPKGGRLVNNDSKGDTMKFVLYRKFSPETLLSLSAGYHQRKYKEFDQRDFHGIIGKADVSYRVTEKLTLSVGAERKLYEETFLDQFYSVNDSLGLGAAYKPAEKIEAFVYGNTTRKSYKGDANILAAAFPEREDREKEFKTGLIWSPIQRLGIDLLYRYSTRDSNFDIYNYEVHGIELGISYKF